MPHYSRAPITEALIDLRVQLPSGVTVADLEKIHAKEVTRYPAKDKQYTFSTQVRLGDEPGTAMAQQEIGWRLRSNDKPYVCQVQLGGFTLSRLVPYDCWETLRAEAQRLWSLYADVAKPQHVTRVAVRYINRLDIPLPLEDFEKYLTAMPRIPPTLPQALAGFFVQVQVPQEGLGGMLILTETLIQPARPDVVSVVLDIDLYKDKDVGQGSDVWSFLEELRVRKNQVFEGCITDAMRELIR